MRKTRVRLVLQLDPFMQETANVEKDAFGRLINIAMIALIANLSLQPAADPCAEFRHIMNPGIIYVTTSKATEKQA